MTIPDTPQALNEQETEKPFSVTDGGMANALRVVLDDTLADSAREKSVLSHSLATWRAAATEAITQVKALSKAYDDLQVAKAQADEAHADEITVLRATIDALREAEREQSAGQGVAAKAPRKPKVIEGSAQ